MRFGMCGMLAGRKDPFALLEAWRELKRERPEFDAILELKTACPGLHPGLVQVYPDVVLYDRVWPQTMLRDWYTTIDVMVSTSRGEGNNKPAIEFMSTGGLVMASDWSGHQNWLHPDATIPIPGQLVTWTDGVRADFRVDIPTLKEQLYWCWQHPDQVRRKGRVAAGLIRSSLSWPQVCERLTRRLAALL